MKKCDPLLNMKNKPPTLADFQRQDRAEAKKRIAETEKIPDCGWGTSSMLFRRTKSGIKHVTDDVLEKIHRVPTGYVLIQKKHLDEAKWALEFSTRLLRNRSINDSMPSTFERMIQALKNISAK